MHTLRLSLGLPLNFSLVLISALIFTALALPTLTHAATCTDTYLSGSSVPAGYGASYNVFSTAKELLVKTTSCTDTALSIKAGNDQATTLVYNEGYHWSGTAWIKYTLTASDPLQFTYYYPKAATANVPVPAGNTSKYYVAYTCLNISDAWKCGCANQTCATRAWQLQKVNKTGDSGGPVCGNNICEAGETQASCAGDCGSKNTACDPPKDDLFKNPFNKNSAHHRPIGTGAVYAGDNDPSTVAWKVKNSVNINASNGWGHRMIASTAQDPLMTIKFDPATPTGYGNGQGLPVTIHIPSNFDGGGTSDGEASVYDASTETFHAFYRLKPPYAAIHYALNARGLPHKNVPSDPRVSTSASGISQIGDLLRGHEVNTPGFKIQHALNFSLPSRANDGGGRMFANKYVWPASSVDGFCSTGVCIGPIPYGALLAIPPVSKGGPNLETLGLSEPGRRVIEALRDYGAYAHDTSGGVTMRADQYVTSSVQSQVTKDLNKVYKYIRMVTNNAKGQTASGGGTPLAPNCAFDAQ